MFFPLALDGASRQAAHKIFTGHHVHQQGALAIRNIHKTYNDTVHILKGIDLEIEAGEFLILVGPSGCGKSTLLSMIAGLDHPTSGSIHIGERDVTNLPSKDRDIAMVFQSYALYPNTRRWPICSMADTRSTAAWRSALGTLRISRPKAMFCATVMLG